MFPATCNEQSLLIASRWVHLGIFMWGFLNFIKGERYTKLTPLPTYANTSSQNHSLALFDVWVSFCRGICIYWLFFFLSSYYHKWRIGYLWSIPRCLFHSLSLVFGNYPDITITFRYPVYMQTLAMLVSWIQMDIHRRLWRMFLRCRRSILRVKLFYAVCCQCNGGGLWLHQCLLCLLLTLCYSTLGVIGSTNLHTMSRDTSGGIKLFRNSRFWHKLIQKPCSAGETLLQNFDGFAGIMWLHRVQNMGPTIETLSSFHMHILVHRVVEIW